MALLFDFLLQSVEGLLMLKEGQLRGLRWSEKPWEGGLELLLCGLREAREDLFEYVLELGRDIVVVPLLAVVVGVVLEAVTPLLLGVHTAGSVCTTAFGTVRLPVHDAPVEDPSTAELSGALDPASICSAFLFSDRVLGRCTGVQRSQTNQH